jgi:hypothetical protein
LHILVARNQLVREGQAGHQAALFKPKNRAERTREEDAFHGRESDEALSKVLRINPRQSPLAFAMHGGPGFERVEEVALLLGLYWMVLSRLLSACEGTFLGLSR